MSRLVHNPGEFEGADDTGFLIDDTKPAVPQWAADVVDAIKARADLAHPSVLQEADAIIHGERQEQYGDPERNFERIAKAWSAYLDQELSGHDVCMMMGLLKIIRAHGDYHRDSLVDLAGYAGLAAIAAGDDE